MEVFYGWLLIEIVTKTNLKLSCLNYFKNLSLYDIKDKNYIFSSTDKDEFHIPQPKTIIYFIEFL